MDQFIWVEKYRPKTIEDCILPPDLQKTFLDMIKQGEVPNLLLVGSPGLGKTTVARALLEQLECDYIFVPASLEGNIDTLRVKIAQFASSVSFTGKRKYVILDESDYMTHVTQPALRNFMEEFSKNCGFILTANYRNKIIPALQSRCSTIEFKFSKEESQKLAARFFKRVCDILKQENVEFDQKVVATLVQKHQPDFRKILNELQRYSVSNKIDTGILSAINIVSLTQLITYMKAKDFTNVRKWVGENLNNRSEDIFRAFYDDAKDFFKPSFIPQLVILTAEYQFKAAFVTDLEINIAAYLVNIMAEAEWV